TQSSRLPTSGQAVGSPPCAPETSAYQPFKTERLNWGSPFWRSRMRAFIHPLRRTPASLLVAHALCAPASGLCAFLASGALDRGLSPVGGFERNLDFSS